MLDRKLIDKYLFVLGFLPAMVCCLLSILMFLLLFKHLRDNEAYRETRFIASLYDNIQLEEENTFESISDALLVSGNYYSLSLLDTTNNLVVSRGVPLTKSLIPMSLSKQPTWTAERKLFISLPIRYFEGVQVRTGWIVISKSGQANTLWFYRAALYLFAFCTLLLVAVRYINKQFKRRLTSSSQYLAHSLKQLQQKNYGYHINEKTTSIYSPMVSGLNQLSDELETSNENSQKIIKQCTADLKEALETIEIQNTKIDLARKNVLKTNQAKSELLINTSHEIRTSLSGVIGFASLLRKTPLNEKQNEYLDIIDDSAKILLLNINDIIDYSRLEIGELNLEYKPVQIRQVIEESHNFILANGADSELDLPTRIPDNIPIKLLGDPMRVMQVYNHLLTNVIDLFHSKTVSTFIEAEDHDGNQVALKVSIVVAGQYQDKARLEEAQQLLSSRNLTNERPKGKNQISLIIAKGLVNRMKGHIGLITKPEERGFWFTVLLGQPDIESRKISYTQKIQTKVLVVDDNTSNRRLARELLQEMNVVVKTAESGREAIALYEKDQFSLILMDIQMPGLNGFETTQKIREKETNGSRIPIVALTAHAVEEEKLVLLMSGMDDFVTKPIGETELHELLLRWTKVSDRPSHCVSQQTKPARQTVDVSLAVDLRSCIELAKGKHELARDLLSMLLNSLDEELDGMRQSWNNKDYTSLHEIVHRIHGGACYCGVPHLLKTSAKLDKMLNDNNIESCEEQLEELISSCNDLLRWKKENNLKTLFEESLIKD